MPTSSTAAAAPPITVALASTTNAITVSDGRLVIGGYQPAQSIALPKFADLPVFRAAEGGVQLAWRASADGGANPVTITRATDAAVVPAPDLKAAGVTPVTTRVAGPSGEAAPFDVATVGGALVIRPLDDAARALVIRTPEVVITTLLRRVARDTRDGLDAITSIVID